MHHPDVRGVRLHAGFSSNLPKRLLLPGEFYSNSCPVSSAIVTVVLATVTHQQRPLSIITTSSTILIFIYQSTTQAPCRPLKRALTPPPLSPSRPLCLSSLQAPPSNRLRLFSSFSESESRPVPVFQKGQMSLSCGDTGNVKRNTSTKYNQDCSDMGGYGNASTCWTFLLPQDSGQYWCERNGISTEPVNITVQGKK
ncbi:hypothetical protein WMY93_031946 [Mugilogobius chulae]|uniref:Ig-like domain-containing protein n=1 Tax=Mugilogobius chulae TaxID=88201 RepID=A0AAW0MCP8_9GOBI